jgi:cold shock CspA family protein
MQGVVKFYKGNGTDGFGFIALSDSGGHHGDIFVHHSEVTRGLSRSRTRPGRQRFYSDEPENRQTLRRRY